LKLTEKAREIAPENLQTAILRGEILLDLGRTNDVMEEAAFALREDPENYAASLLMAKTGLLRNDLETARDLAVSALMRNPRDDDAFVLLAKINLRQNAILGLWWRLHLLLRPFRTGWGIGLSLTGLAIFTAATEPPERGGLVTGFVPPETAAAIADYRLGAWAVILSLASVVLLGHFVTEILVRREIRKVELDSSF
jgi:tetratricopeptide (TPR) repeat protein